MTPTAIATRGDRIQRTLEHLRQHTTDTTGQLVPFGPGQYTDPALAQRERDLVFGRVPSIVAHASELPEPNDFITLQMPRNRVIVARQHDGSVKAFVNVCRHRGALLEEQESGRCRLFSCGYHRWSYNTDGSLRTITREATFGEVDRSRHGLIELPGAGAARPDLDGRPGGRADRRGRLAGPGDGRDPGRVPARRADRLPVRGVRRAVQLEADAGRVRGQLSHPVRAPEHGRQAHPHQRADRGGLRPARPDGEPAQGHRPVAGGGPGRHGPRPVRHRGALPAAEQHAAAPARRPFRAAHLPAAPGRPRALPDGDAAARPAAGNQRDGRAERWEHVWEKNWKILLAVLHQEDFPLLRSSQQGLASADAGGMLLGRNEMVNQIFHRELGTLLAEGSAP